MTPLAITAYTATTAVGPGVAALATALSTGVGALAADTFAAARTGVVLETATGRVAGLEDLELPAPFVERDCRNHRIAWLASMQDDFAERVREVLARVGSHRVALFIGTSTSTIDASEAAYREYAATGVVPATLARRDLHHLHATTAFVRDVFGIGGPIGTVSTACSSSAKVFAQAARLIAAGVVDAAVVGGVDSLAASTLFGFASLGLVASTPCRPFDVARDGISIGEAAGFALVERHDPARNAAAPLLVGYGESSDAHHMSAPHPDGTGARIAIGAALATAGIGAEAIDHVNLHGTATPRNDAVEAAVVTDLFGPSTRAASTKGLTGHTLGAAGIVEAVACLLALRDGFAPGTAGCATLDPACGPQVRIARSDGDVAIALSNAFAFGGNNCVLAFARDADALGRARAQR